MLGALLLVGEQLLGDAPVLLGARAARARAGDRARLDSPVVDGHERLGAGAGDLEVAEVEEVHVRARVDRAQAAVDRERLDRDLRRPALARDDLVGVAGVDVLDDPLDHALELLARHVARPGRRLAVGGRPLGRLRHRPGEAAAHVGDRLDRLGVGALEVVVVRVDVGEDRQLAAQVVERDAARRSASARGRARRPDRGSARRAARPCARGRSRSSRPRRRRTAAGPAAAPGGDARPPRPPARTGRPGRRATSAARCAA